MRTVCVCLCWMLMCLLLAGGCLRHESQLLNSERVRSAVTVDAERMFSKTCAAEDTRRTENELRVLVDRYRDGTWQLWGCECTVRWETVTAESYWFRDAVDVRVFVKQQHAGITHR